MSSEFRPRQTIDMHDPTQQQYQYKPSTKLKIVREQEDVQLPSIPAAIKHRHRLRRFIQSFHDLIFPLQRAVREPR